MFQRESLDILKLSQAIKKCDAILIGAGAGLSSAAGLSYSGNRFKKYFNDFITKYHLQDMYSAGFYPYPSLEKYWAYWSRHIYYNRYLEAPKDTYKKLLNLLINKDYFVITTNVDHQFQILKKNYFILKEITDFGNVQNHAIKKLMIITRQLLQ